jgi:DNA-binding CsgD family transcriptional regulator
VTSAPVSSLTPAERDAALAMRYARNEAEAAGKLGIRPATIHELLRRGRARTGCQTTRQLVALVAAEGSVGWPT